MYVCKTFHCTTNNKRIAHKLTQKLRVEVDVLGSLSLIDCTVTVDVKQH